MAWTERYVRADAAGGLDGTSNHATDQGGGVGAWTWLEAGAGFAAGHRVNVKAGTYNETALNSRATSGTLSSPVWFRAFETTPGDLDDAPLSQLTPGTNMPFINRTAEYDLFTGAYVNFSGIAFKTNVSTRPAFYGRTLRAFMRRCRFEHTGSGATDYAFTTVSGGNYKTMQDCYFKLSHASATANCVISGAHTDFLGCVFHGPAGAILLNLGSTLASVQNSIFSGGLNAISLTGSVAVTMASNTFYNSASDAIVITGSTAAGIINTLRNYFHTIGGYAINCSAATFGNMLISGNCYYNLTTGQLNGIAESLQFDSKTDSVDRFANAGTGDFTLTAASNGRGVQTLFEAAGPSRYSDIGAIQHQDAGGASTVIVIED